MEHSVSARQITRAEDFLAQGVEAGLYTHAVYALARGGVTVALRAFGAAAPETVFDLASLTKPLATAACLLQGVEAGRLHMHQSVGGFFEEEFGPLPHLVDVEVHHLLTHTSGLPPIPRWPLSVSAGGSPPTRQDRISSVLTTPLLRRAGEAYTYSDAGFILLGEIVARITGKPLASCVQEQIAAPLGLSTLGFGPRSDTQNVAPTGAETPGVVNDPRARDLGGVAGHAGLFGTAGEVLTFAEAVRSGGGPILSPASVRRMSVSQIAPSVGAQSWGWFCAPGDYLPSGDLFSDRAFGHSGFTGTLVLIDPAFDISLALLTNRVVNTQEDGSRFLRHRRLWLNTVAAALL